MTQFFPVIEHPTYSVQLLSKPTPIRIRPFTVKEQKLLLMAVEAKDIDTTVKAVKQIITNCSIDPINVDDLPLVDLETLFLNLRARSLGEVLNLYFKCNNQVIVPPSPNSTIAVSYSGIPLHEYKPCGMIIEVPVNLLKIPVVNKDTPKKIMITESLGVMMKYPSMEMIDKLINSNTSSDALFDIIAACIETVFDKENVYKTKEATMEEVIKFVEDLPADKMDALEKFIENVPKNKFETKKKCPKCGYEYEFALEGLSDFFQ